VELVGCCRWLIACVGGPLWPWRMSSTSNVHGVEQAGRARWELECIGWQHCRVCGEDEAVAVAASSTAQRDGWRRRWPRASLSHVEETKQEAVRHPSAPSFPACCSLHLPPSPNFSSLTSTTTATVTPHHSSRPPHVQLACSCPHPHPRHPATKIEIAVKEGASFCLTELSNNVTPQSGTSTSH